MIDLSTLEKRKTFLTGFKETLSEKFKDVDYNVFIFGSFVTDKFKPDKSDIDVAVFCKDVRVGVKISNFVEKYCSEVLAIDCDVLLIDTGMDAFVDIDACTSRYKMTDYFPVDLQEYIANLAIKRRDFYEFSDNANFLYRCELERRYSS